MSCRDFTTSDTDLGYTYAALKLGVFIHYGLNTYAGETGFTDNPSETFDPSTTYPATDFAPTAVINMQDWLRPAKMAGATYAIFTTKHHFGWCGWPTATTAYDIASATDPQAPTDMVDDFTTACAALDIEPVLYYSVADRDYANTDYRMDDASALTFMKAQLTELLDGTYGNIFGVWLDAVAYGSTANQDALYAHIKTLQPNCVVLANRGPAGRTGDGCGTNEGIIDGRSDISVYEGVLSPDPYYLPLESEFKLDTTTAWWGWTDDIIPSSSATEVNAAINHNISTGAAYAMGLHVGPNGALSQGQLTFLRNLGIARGVISDKQGINYD